MSTATWITGSTLEVLRRMPSDSVDLVMTSPPFLALRSYLPDDDPAKAHEIGQESTPGEFIDALVEIVEELRRIVALHHTPLYRAANNFVVNISDIAHIAHLQAAGFEPALHHVKGHHHAGMANVAVVVHRHAAHIHAHLPGYLGFKRLYTAG